jgi:hypothetical protein
MRIPGETLPSGECMNWPICQALFPHVEYSWQTWAAVLHKGVQYAFKYGRYISAESMALESLETRTRILGPENTHTLDIVDRLAIELKARENTKRQRRWIDGHWRGERWSRA